MPESEPELDAATQAVIGRWNPQGLALLRSLSGGESTVPVTVFGPDDANSRQLRSELACCTPQVTLTDPADPPNAPAAALVLLDAGGSVGAATLRLVAWLAANRTRIVFALDGIHAHPQWRTTLAEAEAALAPVLGAARVPTADTSPDPAVRAAPASLAAGMPAGAARVSAAVPEASMAEAATTPVFRVRPAEVVPVAVVAAARPAPVAGAQPVPVAAAEPAPAGPLRIVPVSARLAAAARTANDGALLDRSGLTALHTALVEVAGAGDRRQAVTVEQVLTATTVRIEEQAAAVRSGSEAARLREQRGVLLAGRDGGRAQAMSSLRNQLQLARVDLLHEAGARIRALHAAARTDIERLGRAALDDYPAHLESGVHTAAAELDEFANRRLAEIARGLTAPGDEPVAPLVPRIDPPPSPGPGPEPRQRGLEDRVKVALGASAGFGVGRLVMAPLELVPALNYAGMPVTLLLGGGIAYWVVRARGQLEQQAYLRQWAADALGNVKAQLEQRVSTRLVGAESRFTDDVVRLTTARAVADQHRLAEVESQLRQLRERQPAQLAACDRDLKIVSAALTDNAARIARGVEMT